MKWRIGTPQSFQFDSWRMYVAICGLPSVIMGLIMTQMPESPRFLLLQGKLLNAWKVLLLMFKINTGRNSVDFPVSCYS